MGQLGHAQGGERGLLGRFDDDGAARGQRRADLPGEHEEREVPGQDKAHHTDGFTHHHRDVIVRGRGNLIIHLINGFRVPLDAVDRLRDVHGFAIKDGLAAVQALHHCEFAGVAGEEFGETDEDVFALGRVHP